EDELDGDGAGEQELRRDFRDRTPGAIDDDRGARVGDAGQQFGVRREIELDHGVDAAPAGDRRHPRTDILALVVDDMVGAAGAGRASAAFGGVRTVVIAVARAAWASCTA